MAAGGEKQASFEALVPSASIDNAFLTLQQTQAHFSSMADAKANLMITISSVVISVSLTQLRKEAFFLPLVVLDAFTAAALISALLCVLPWRSTPRLRDGRVDVASPSFNPLFFLHFQHLSLAEFEDELVKRLRDTGALYRSLARDIYGQGVVLARSKYRFLRFSYLAFVAGLLASAATLIGQSL